MALDRCVVPPGRHPAHHQDSVDGKKSTPRHRLQRQWTWSRRRPGAGRCSSAWTSVRPRHSLYRRWSSCTTYQASGRSGYALSLALASTSPKLMYRRIRREGLPWFERLPTKSITSMFPRPQVFLIIDAAEGFRFGRRPLAARQLVENELRNQRRTRCRPPSSMHSASVISVLGNIDAVASVQLSVYCQLVAQTMRI